MQEACDESLADPRALREHHGEVDLLAVQLQTRYIVLKAGTGLPHRELLDWKSWKQDAQVVDWEAN